MGKKGGLFILFLLLVALSWYTSYFFGEDETIQKEGTDDEFIKEYLKTQLENKDTIKKEGETSGSLTNTTSITIQLQTDLEDCPTECCVGRFYLQKNCTSNFFECINGSCMERQCPHECCVFGMFPDKPCRTPLGCVNYTCERLECPKELECCSQEDYVGGGCDIGYDCIEHRCSPIDTDKDGLEDVIEANYGTNKTNIDTDGDGLSDAFEIRTLKTDPTNKNTDGDRYSDYEDPNPVTKESAQIILSQNTEVKKNLDSIHALLRYLDFNQPMPDPNASVGDFETQILVKNNGTDYTDSINFTLEIGYWCAPGVDVRRKPFVIQYVANNTNLTVVNSTIWVDSRGDWTDGENRTSWRLKQINYTLRGRLPPMGSYFKFVRNRLLVGELTNETRDPIVSTRRCGYNFTFINLEYEQF